MGDVYKSSYTTPLPNDATINGQSVTWTDKRGKRKVGKLTANHRVLIETNKWVARWSDENGREQKAAGTRNAPAPAPTKA